LHIARESNGHAAAEMKRERGIAVILGHTSSSKVGGDLARHEVDAASEEAV
jgi:hypothetical protein